MHDDKSIFDWMIDIGGAGPTWLELVASHASMLSAFDVPNYGSSEPKAARPIYESPSKGKR